MDNGASSYRRFLDGDEKAFDDVMKELFHSLVFFIHRYVQDIHTAEDLAMDVFADLIVHRHRYNFKVTLKTYLFMLGRSRALDYIKHRKVIEFTELSDADAADEGSLEDAILASQRQKAIHGAIERLPEDMQVAVHLYYFEGLSYAECGKIMKKTPKQVDNLLYWAKKELRSLLGKEGEQLL